MDMAKLSLVLKNDLNELENLCRHIDIFCKFHGLGKRNAFELNLVVDEIFTNIVSYGFNNHQEHFIHIDVQIINEELIIRIEDDGIPFDPSAIPEKNLKCSLENRQIGGLGLHLVNRIMKHVKYKRIGNKNILVLKKNLDTKTGD